MKQLFNLILPVSILWLTACQTVQQSLYTRVENGTLHRTLRQSMFDKKRKHHTITSAQSLFDTRGYTLVKQERKGDTLTTLLELQARQGNWNITKKSAVPAPFVVTSRASMKSSFRWFTTQREYRETFSVRIPPFPVPWSRYLTREEMTYWVMGTPRLTDGLSGSETNELLYNIKEKFDRWRNACEFEWQYSVLLKHYDRIKNAPVSKDEFMRQRETVLNRYLTASNDMSPDQKLQNALVDVFHSTAGYQALLNDSVIMAPITARVEQLIDFANFRMECRWKLPGRITRAENVLVTPSKHKDEQMLSLNLTGERMLLGTYTVTVETETRNIWAWLLTIAVTLCLLVWYVKRKGKSRFTS